jgi:hypothetical protein
LAISNISLPQQKVQILQALQLLHKPGDVIELRIPDAGKAGTVGGYFNNFDKLADTALTWSGKVSAIYIILNTVNPALQSLVTFL